MVFMEIVKGSLGLGFELFLEKLFSNGMLRCVFEIKVTFFFVVFYLEVIFVDKG